MPWVKTRRIVHHHARMQGHSVVPVVPTALQEQIYAIISAIVYLAKMNTSVLAICVRMRNSIAMENVSRLLIDVPANRIAVREQFFDRIRLDRCGVL